MRAIPYGSLFSLCPIPEVYEKSSEVFSFTAFMFRIFFLFYCAASSSRPNAFLASELFGSSLINFSKYGLAVSKSFLELQ